MSSDSVNCPALLDPNLLPVVLRVPRSERRAIDGNDSRFHQRLRSQQFVIGRVVHDVDNSRLSCDVFATPGKVTIGETQGAKLDVAASASHLSNVLRGRELRVRRLSSEFVSVDDDDDDERVG